MKHLYNTLDPSNPKNASYYTTGPLDKVMRCCALTGEVDIVVVNRYYDDKIIGDPVATECYTVNELLRDGYVGIYAK
jgi:hypothetical protein